MSDYRITERAGGDLTEIADHIRADNPAAAARVIESLLATFAILATAPGAGRRRDDLERGIRSFPVGNYLVFYREVNGTVEILRVIHGRRDIKKAFGA